jgi:transcriptional regulator
MYSEYILRRVGFEDNIGIKVGGRTINNLQYADNTTILAEDKEDMRKLLKKLKEESEKAGLKLNLKKTKIMTRGTLNEFILDGTEMEIINCYTFLGFIITRDGYDYKEINKRLSTGRMAMAKLEKNYEGSGR